MTYEQYLRNRDFTPTAVLDALIAAGLGDVEQRSITREQYEQAMSGTSAKARDGRRGNKHNNWTRRPAPAGLHAARGPRQRSVAMEVRA